MENIFYFQDYYLNNENNILDFKKIYELTNKNNKIKMNQFNIDNLKNIFSTNILKII